MARKRTKPEQSDEQPSEATPEEIAATEAALRAWTDTMRGAPERALKALEVAAKAALRDFGLPDDVGPHRLSDLPPERGRDYWKSHVPIGPAVIVFPDHIAEEDGRVQLNEYLRPDTAEWRAAEILVAVREVRRATNPADAVVWTTRAAGQMQQLKRALGGVNRKRRYSREDEGLLVRAQQLWNANPRWTDDDLDAAVAAEDPRSTKRQPKTLRRRLINPAIASGALKKPRPR